MVDECDLVIPYLDKDSVTDEQEENIPGLSPSQLVDLKATFHGHYEKAFRIGLACSSEATKAQYLLFSSVHELEAEAACTLQAQFSFPVYPFGPAIPYLELSRQHSNDIEKNYFEWLNAQPKGSVLYISFGSFLSVSAAQMDEFAAGLCDSGVRFLWVARSEATRLCGISNGDMGLVISWCDQLRVLCHPSIGGFWTHCGWNSTMEAIFGGVPMLTLPLFLDQVANCRKIVEEWKIGLKVEREIGNENLIGREQVSEIVKRFMDNVSEERKEMRKRCKDLVGVCHQAVAKGGSSDINLSCFIRDICERQGQN